MADISTNSSSIETQIVFKLGGIETAVNSLKDNVESAFRRLEKKIDDTSRKAEIDTAKLELKVEHQNGEVEKLQQWKNTMNMRIGAVAAAVSVFWLVFGQAIDNLIKRLF